MHNLSLFNLLVIYKFVHIVHELLYKPCYLFIDMTGAPEYIPVNIVPIKYII